MGDCYQCAHMAWFSWLKRYGRWLLLAFGALALVLLIRHVGALQVLATLKTGGFWLPVIMLLEAAWIGMDVLALKLFYGAAAKQVSLRQWCRSMMMHYVVMVLFPAGRAGAEITRAAMLAPVVGGHRASAGAVQIQSVVLIANALISTICLVAVVLVAGSGSGLLWLLFVNAVGTLFLGAMLYLGARIGNVGSWLGRRIKSLSRHGPEVDALLSQAPLVPWGPLGCAAVGRAIQTLQYGVVLYSVGGNLSLLNALITEGIHLVGAGLGDMVPNQVGITEGAYSIFAGMLGVGAAAAVSIALLARLGQFTLAGLYWIAATLLSDKEDLGESSASLSPD